MPTVVLRFYAELNDFLPPEKQRGSTYLFETEVSVGEVLKDLGVPHTQVDLILVNGRSVDFSYVVRDGDRVSFYPVFEALNIAPLVRLRRHPLRQVRFVLDTHLGELARYLRLLGFDSLYRSDYAEEELVRISVAERRILLTRNADLLRHKELTHAYWVQATDPKRQLCEVIERFDLSVGVTPLTRQNPELSR